MAKMEGILPVFPGTTASILGSSENQLEDKADVLEEGRNCHDRCTPWDLGLQPTTLLPSEVSVPALGIHEVPVCLAHCIPLPLIQRPLLPGQRVRANLDREKKAVEVLKVVD